MKIVEVNGELGINIDGVDYTATEALNQFGNDPDVLKELKTAIVSHINGQEQEQFGGSGGVTR